MDRQQWKSLGAVAAIALVLGFGSRAEALITTGSWFLDQSNTFADGVNYGQVDIEANDVTGEVKFTVDAFTPAAYGTIGTNFGIQTFGFNTQGVTDAPNIWGNSLPTGWTQSTNKNQDGFGKFVITENGSGSTRQDPLIFTITLPTASQAIAGNFAVLSTGSAGEGNVFFAAHVAGFTSSQLGDDNKPIGSHFIGGSTVVATVIPAPSAVALALIGIGVSVRRMRSAR